MKRTAATYRVMLLAMTFGSLGTVIAECRAETLRWVCEYPVHASPDGISKENFRLEFALDTVSRKALLIGNAGVAEQCERNATSSLGLQFSRGAHGA